MKTAFLFLLSLFFIRLHAQTVLPLDENKKNSFEEIVKVDSTVNKYQLYKKAEDWLLKNFKDKECTVLDINTGSLKSCGSFLVYTKGVVSKEIHGRIDYDVMLDVKDGKYRYKFTNFVFHYYKITRNYKYEPTGKTKPLEDEKFPGWESAWRKHKAQTNFRITALISSLKTAMEKTELPKPEEKTKVKKEEW